MTKFLDRQWNRDREREREKHAKRLLKRRSSSLSRSSHFNSDNDNGPSFSPDSLVLMYIGEPHWTNDFPPEGCAQAPESHPIASPVRSFCFASNYSETRKRNSPTVNDRIAWYRALAYLSPQDGFCLCVYICIYSQTVFRQQRRQETFIFIRKKVTYNLDWAIWAKI